MELGQLRFVVDENTLAVGKVMQQLRDDVAYVGDPLISSLIPRRSLDKHWIPVAAEHGWVAITNDHHMRTRHYEASLALEHGLMVVNIKGVGHRTAAVVCLVFSIGSTPAPAAMPDEHAPVSLSPAAR